MAITKYVSTPKLEDYKKQFAEHMVFERKNGILQVRLATNGGPVKWSFEMLQAMGECWNVIGHDPENEIIILTSTDPYWIGEFDTNSFRDNEANPDVDIRFNASYHSSTKIVENWLYDINVPTIGAINGPGLHWECAMMSDITLCTPDFVIRDDHFGDATVPGDWQGACLQSVLGIKRGAYMMFMVNGIDAKTAQEWGLINEVLPKEKLLPRAWEIAEKIMKQPRIIRHLTHQVTTRPWRRIVQDDYTAQLAIEMYGGAMRKMKHHFEEIIKENWSDKEKEKGK